ncbi:MAG: hypothetical protein K9K75_02470 [Deltaproteobacteria bacterium]|nr:hypothetical protein [Deltaproteobacteria bacterium]
MRAKIATNEDIFISKTLAQLYLFASDRHSRESGNPEDFVMIVLFSESSIDHKIARNTTLAMEGVLSIKDIVCLSFAQPVR